MQLTDRVSEMDAMVSAGQIIDAVQKFFHDDARTFDSDDVTTANKGEMLEKMNGFVGAIRQVNAITFHRSMVDGDVSMSEFTFDFDMQDGGHVRWHEIISREWNDDKVVSERYFKN